jgi:hypothetical protein
VSLFDEPRRLQLYSSGSPRRRPNRLRRRHPNAFLPIHPRSSRRPDCTDGLKRGRLSGQPSASATATSSPYSNSPTSSTTSSKTYSAQMVSPHPASISYTSICRRMTRRSAGRIRLVLLILARLAAALDGAYVSCDTTRPRWPRVASKVIFFAHIPKNSQHGSVLRTFWLTFLSTLPSFSLFVLNVEESALLNSFSGNSLCCTEMDR